MPVYEDQCPKCSYIYEYYSPFVTSETKSCPKCGGSTERIYSLFKARVFQVFTSRNILESGEPITVRGEGQLRQLETDHGVKLADGPPPQTRVPEIS